MHYQDLNSEDQQEYHKKASAELKEEMEAFEKEQLIRPLNKPSEEPDMIHHKELIEMRAKLLERVKKEAFHMASKEI